VAVADYRDPIVERFHAIYRARALEQVPDAADIEAVTAWLRANLEQSARCGRGECDHAA
jgi:hypothetical protein